MTIDGAPGKLVAELGADPRLRADRVANNALKSVSADTSTRFSSAA
jgi:hypothetical protein